VFCAGTGRRLSFQSIESRSNRLANALISLGLERGSVVAFICSNRAEIIEIYFALAKAGLVGLPLNYRLSCVEMSILINTMRGAALIIESRFGAAHSQLRAECPGLAHSIWIGPDAPGSCREYEGLIGIGATCAPDIDVDENDPCYFNLTSGTTGLPKAYVVTHYSACQLLTAILSTDCRADDVSLTTFPAYGRVGLSSLLVSIMMGTRNVLVNFDADVVLRLIEEEAVTFTWLVPTMAALLLAALEVRSRQLGSLRAIGFVGAMLPASIREQSMARLCPRIYEGYGLQESGMLTISTPGDRTRKPDSVGKPVLFAEVRVVDGNGDPLGAGEVGEIVGRSPNCITGYYQSPAKNAEVFRQGWFHTGDLGFLDEDGYLSICGRLKDLIISGGQNIHSAEIEATLLTLAGVIECAVVGLPHEVWGEIVAAVVVAPSGATLDVRQVQEFCRQRLATFKVPRQVVFQKDPLPRTPTGKVQKFLLVERYRNTVDDGTELHR
jgi:fatty-acyl-CoA synthase